MRRYHGSVSGTEVGYRLRQPDGATVLVRAYRAEVLLAPHFRGCGTASVTDWLLGRAATLDWLAAQGYPAPRVVATRTGDLVGVAGAWLTWATSYVPGRALPPGGGQAGLLGAALGRLHALGPRRAPGAGARVVASGGGGPGRAWPARRGRADAAGGVAPAARAVPPTLLAVAGRCPGLPVAVVHGDAWPGNAVLTPSGEAVLIDWENGGLGLPVLDLGYCLLECHLDPGLPAGQPEAWHISAGPGADRRRPGRLRPLAAS